MNLGLVYPQPVDSRLQQVWPKLGTSVARLMPTSQLRYLMPRCTDPVGIVVENHQLHRCHWWHADMEAWLSTNRESMEIHGNSWKFMGISSNETNHQEDSKFWPTNIRENARNGDSRPRKMRMQSVQMSIQPMIGSLLLQAFRSLPTPVMVKTM